MMRQKATKSALIRWQRQWSLWRFQQPTMLSRKEDYEGRHRLASGCDESLLAVK
jgi:hypothetical protein